MMVGTLMNSMKFSHNFRTRSQRGIWTHLASESWRRWIGVTTGWESLPGIPIESKMTCHPKFNPKHSSQDVGSFLLYVGSVEESMSWSVWGVSHFASCPFDFVAVWCFFIFRSPCDPFRPSLTGICHFRPRERTVFHPPFVRRNLRFRQCTPPNLLDVFCVWFWAFTIQCLRVPSWIPKRASIVNFGLLKRKLLHLFSLI